MHVVHIRGFWSGLSLVAQQSDAHSICTCWSSSNQQTTLCFPQSNLVVSTSLTTIRQIESFPQKIRGENTNRCIFTTTYNLQYHIWKVLFPPFHPWATCTQFGTDATRRDVAIATWGSFTIQVSEGKFYNEMSCKHVGYPLDIHYPQTYPKCPLFWDYILFLSCWDSLVTSSI